MPATPDTYQHTGDQYKITCYLPPDAVPKIVFEGTMRLENAEEPPVTDLLACVIDNTGRGDTVVVDLQKLAFINSRGISVLYKFAINLRNKNVDVNILAIKQSTWQQATLGNITKLSPNSTITWTEAVD